MAGHSKWAQIKRQKAKNDVAKGALFARLSREIIVATRLGGADPAGNFRLRIAIEQARAASLPNENIQRAIDKGAGNLGGEQLEEVRYEGYGPAGVAVLIEALTDNRNRTVANLRTVFSRHGGNLGETGCVGWMFEQKGVVALDGWLDEEVLLDTALEGGASSYDIDPEGQGAEVFTEPDGLEHLSDVLVRAGFTVGQVSVRWISNNVVTLEDSNVTRMVLTLLEKLEDLDDVQRVASNYDVENDILDLILA